MPGPGRMHPAEPEWIRFDNQLDEQATVRFSDRVAGAMRGSPNRKIKSRRTIAAVLIRIGAAIFVPALMRFAPKIGRT